MKLSRCYKVTKNTKVSELNFDLIRNDLETLNYDSSTVFKTILVIEEVITNILKYSENPNDITTALNLADDEIILNIEDYGKQFDPTSAKKANITKDIEEREIGGLGIHLVKQFSKNISYHRVGGHNILQITLKAIKTPIENSATVQNLSQKNTSKIRSFTECTIMDAFNDTVSFDIEPTLFKAALI
jgi:serine/threonine-protein kinase RsbW